MRHAARAVIVKDNALLVMHRNKFGHEYYALPGGGIDAGETPEQALTREIHEEATITFSNPRLVISEDAGTIFGLQHIYVCQYVSGEPALSPDSEEAKITALGQNLYKPLWLPLSELPQVELLPKELKQVLLENLPDKWPAEPLQLKIPD
jgi:8-oxo-dGTP pyrophosphatase MutT (NUDIX family)